MCPRCQERGQTWRGSPPVCAFYDGRFTGDNWNCATMNALRDKATSDWNEDNYMGFLRGPNGDHLIMTWYKRRGRTSDALVVCDGIREELTLEMAEVFLKWSADPSGEGGA